MTVHSWKRQGSGYEVEFILPSKVSKTNMDSHRNGVAVILEQFTGYRCLSKRTVIFHNYHGFYTA
jgi:hypothetical protein